MLNPVTFIGAPLNFQDKFYIYPPTVKEVLTNPHYNQFVRILTITQEDITDDLIKKGTNKNFPTPFEFLLINCYNSETFKKIAQAAFSFFIHKQVSFLCEQKMIVIGKIEEAVQSIHSLKDLIIIQEEDYFDFQNTIRAAIGEKKVNLPEPIDPDEDPRITRMKAKARERDRIKAKKGVQGGISLSTSLVAICCMGIGITPLNIGEMSYASISPIMKMVQDKEKYDVDVRSLLAGADSKKIKPKYWIRNSD